MEKGKIKIHKSGKVKKCTNSAGKGVSVPGIFDFTQFLPAEGTKEYDCELEVDEKGRVNKIIIKGTFVPFLEDKLGQRKKKEKEKQEEAENREIIDFYKTDFVDLKKTFIPKDTEIVLNQNEWKIDNFSLKFNKLPRHESDKFQFFKTDRGKIIYEPKSRFSEELISEIQRKNLKAVENLIGKENLNKLKLKPNWRLIVGLGSESVYETSITLHHIYGIPYIPASSIKGVVRNYIINEYFGNPERGTVPSDEKDFPLVNAEYRALTTSEEFCKIFGCPKEIKKVIFEDNKPKHKKNKEGKETEKYETENTPTPVALLNEEGKPTEHIGSITFFDAFPIEKPIIEPDIMNVHYPDYYGKDNVPPTDYQNPNPIFFLTVKDTPFQFIIGSKKEALKNFEIGGKAISEWLKDALENHGIGAKTAVGYGRLS